MTRLLRRAGALALFAIVGCGSVQMGDQARDVFVKSESCPASSLRVVQRPDIPVGGPRETPPTDVAQDPARLAIWQKNHTPDQHARAAYEVSGCGHDVVYECVINVCADYASSDTGSCPNADCFPSPIQPTH